jgi:uncharacterized YigZ family protein
MQEDDQYKTIKGTAEGYYKEKGSKFIAKVFHVESEEEVKSYLLQLRKEYHDARHHCYAFRINPENEYARSNDDGEPSGSAGKPIMNQILSAGLYNVLVVVIRYFGGTKLGIPGLIRAYKTATLDAFAQAEIVTEYITRQITLQFDYPQTSQVMRIVKEINATVKSQHFTAHCELVLTVKRNSEKHVVEKLKRIKGLTVN